MVAAALAAKTRQGEAGYMLRALSLVREAERCKGEGRDGGMRGGRAGRIICASISMSATQGGGGRGGGVAEWGWEGSCAGPPVNRGRGKKRKRKEGEGGESSLALYANQEDLRAAMSHD